jgi:serine/threonine protein kinase
MSMPTQAGRTMSSVAQSETGDRTASTGDDRGRGVPTAAKVPTEDATTVAQTPEREAGAHEVLGVFGRYELLQEVAAGGMGVVYKARDTTLGRIVALKMIRSGALARADEVERFHREARAVANLRHPHIIDIYEVGQHEGQHYFTMAFAEGGSLDKHLGRFGDDRAAAALVAKIARAVHYAHERGVLHRDLKPANVVLDSGDEPRVCDFGLAKLLDSDVELTQTGQFVGTPAYMAPEQAVSRSEGITGAADVWALGVLLYQLLTGRRPFTSKQRDVLLLQIRTSTPPDPSSVRPGVNRTLEAIVLKCLAKDPGQRYASAGLLADDLSHWLQGEPTRERQPSLPRRWWWHATRHPWRSAFIALVTVLLVALAGGMVRQMVREPAPVEPAPLVLIDDHGARLPLQWIFGSNNVRTVSDPGAPFSVQASGLSMAELEARVPWERYRLEAEMRHDDAAGFSEIGLFVAHGAPSSVQGVPRSFIGVGFADQGLASGNIQPFIGRIDQPEGSSVEVHLFARMHNFTPAQETGQPSPFRKLDLEVTPDKLRVFFEGQLIGALSRADIELRGNHLFREFPGVHYQYVPQDGVGIYLRDATTTLGRMIIKPLPPPTASNTA